MFSKVLQNKAGVFLAVNFVVFTIFTLEKRVSQCFITFCKTIHAHFISRISSFTLILATKKEEIIDY
jgi:hypothetical protein